MPKPLVSVIISAFNRPKMLLAAIHSVQSQTYEQLEIIIRDDSTNDECQRVVLNLCDSRVRYVHNIPSLGTAANLRAGYRESSGKYFSTLNDDDLYAPDYIAQMVEVMEANPRLSLAFCDHYIINHEGDILTQETEQATHIWKRDLLRDGDIDRAIELAIVHKSIPAMFAVFRRESIDLDDFPDEVSSGYDYWLSYLAVREGNPIYYTSRRMTYYRVHHESQTASFSDPLKRLQFSRYSQYINKKLLSDPRLDSIHSALYPRLAGAHVTAGFALLRLSHRMEAFNEFMKSLRIRPSASVFAGLIFCSTPQFILKAISKNDSKAVHIHI
jgi:glycosyltransferase involved in cell wall biosynthesis